MSKEFDAKIKAIEEEILKKTAELWSGGTIKIVDTGADSSLVFIKNESSVLTLTSFSTRTTVYCCGMVEFGRFHAHDTSDEILELMLRRKILLRQVSTGCFIATVNAARSPQQYKRVLEKIGFTPIGTYRNRNTSNILESYIYIPESNAVTPKATAVKSDLVVS